MHLLKYDRDAKTLTEVMPGEWAGDPACRYFFVEGKRAAVPILTHDGIGEIVWEHPSYQPPLPANQHRATDEAWNKADWYDSCLLELRDRIQQLESAQLAHAPAPARRPQPLTLVERVGRAIENSDDAIPAAFTIWTSEALAADAIREVAAWLRSEYPQREGYGTAFANLLDDHAGQ